MRDLPGTLLALSLAGEPGLRRSKATDVGARTIHGNTASALVDSGLAQDWLYAGGEKGIPPCRWVTLTDAGRKVLETTLRRRES